MEDYIIVDCDYSNFQYDYSKRNIDYESITQEDRNEIYLLKIQHSADIVTLLADALTYISTIESIDLIYSKYDDNLTELLNPDIPAVQALELYMFVRIIYTIIGVIRYKNLYEKKIDGKIDFSLEPEININISNILRSIGTYYALIAIIDIYNRHVSQPIIGV